jgi:hypothetical protein
MDFDTLCKSILEIDPQIRFAGICDHTGEIKHGGHADGIQNLLSADETKRSNLQALARWGLRNTLSPKIGYGKYSMTEYERIKRITIPLKQDHLLLVTTEIQADHVKIIQSILKII